jgi:hypothetical protein
VTDSLLPAPTVETQTTIVWIPEGAVDAPALVPGSALTHLRVTGPNPFFDRVGLTYAIGRDGTASGAAPVRLSVHDVQGRLVRVLQEGAPGDGEKAASWDGRDGAGSRVTPGVYFLRLRAGAETKTAKAVLVR